MIMKQKDQIHGIKEFLIQHIIITNNMVVKYKVEGTIKVNLNNDELDELESHKSETIKIYLQE